MCCLNRENRWKKENHFLDNHLGFSGIKPSLSNTCYRKKNIYILKWNFNIQLHTLAQHTLLNNNINIQWEHVYKGCIIFYRMKWTKNITWITLESMARWRCQFKQISKLQIPKNKMYNWNSHMTRELHHELTTIWKLANYSVL